MKKFVFVFAVALAAGPYVFAQSSESAQGAVITTEFWRAFGFNFANNFFSDNYLGDSWAGLSGLNFSRYRFVNHGNIGSFYNMAILFPAANTIGNNFEPSAQFDILMGIAFRNAVNRSLSFYSGLGFNLHFSHYTAESEPDNIVSDSRFSIGIGVDAGLKFNLTDVAFMKFGSAVLFNFANRQVLNSTTDNWVTTRRESSGWLNGATNLGVRPYLVFGFNRYLQVRSRGVRHGIPEAPAQSATN